MEAEGAIHDDARFWAFDTLHGCCGAESTTGYVVTAFELIAGLDLEAGGRVEELGVLPGQAPLAPRCCAVVLGILAWPPAVGTDRAGPFHPKRCHTQEQVSATSLPIQQNRRSEPVLQNQNFSPVPVDALCRATHGLCARRQIGPACHGLAVSARDPIMSFAGS